MKKTVICTAVFILSLAAIGMGMDPSASSNGVGAQGGGLAGLIGLIFFFFALLIWLLPGILAVFLAGNKGRSKLGWLALCAICPPCIIVIMVLPPTKEFEKKYQKNKNLLHVICAVICIFAFFIMLLMLTFFLFTSTLVKESGVNVNRPGSFNSTDQDSKSITISVMKDGIIMIDGHQIDISLVKSKMETFKNEHPDGNVIINSTYKRGTSGPPIEVLDQVRLAGIKNVIMATETK